MKSGDTVNLATAGGSSIPVVINKIVTQKQLALVHFPDGKTRWVPVSALTAVQSPTQEVHMSQIAVTRESLIRSLGNKPTDDIVKGILSEETPSEKFPNLNKVGLGTEPKEGQVLNVTMDVDYGKIGSVLKAMKVDGSTDIKNIKLDTDKVTIKVTSMKKPEEVDVFIKKQNAKNVTYTWGSK